MRHDPDGVTVVLSPHLDDAVLGAFTMLAGLGEVIVVNVCDGVPPAGRASDWVRLCGGNDDAGQMRLRHKEDRQALATVGRRALGLGFLEADERPLQAVPEEIVRRLATVVPAAARLLAPVGMGSHPDHLATSQAAVRLAGQLPVELYADIPYALRVGWPAWVTGTAPDPHVDADVPWERALGRLAVQRERLSALVVPLDEATRAAKARALECYTSQIGAIAGGPHRRFDDEALGYEVRWRITATPTE
jgi:LmbE family N-acetylglucosaminyl deacetylase